MKSDTTSMLYAFGNHCCKSSGKSTLQTNAGQDCNFQRTLSAIGPYEFPPTTNHWSIPFLGKFVWTNADLFLRRFREGISFPKFVERSVLNCPPPSSVLCLLLYRMEHLSREEKRAKRRRERGGRGVASKGGKKEKRTCENRSEWS